MNQVNIKNVANPFRVINLSINVLYLTDKDCELKN